MFADAVNAFQKWSKLAPAGLRVYVSCGALFASKPPWFTRSNALGIRSADSLSCEKPTSSPRTRYLIRSTCRSNGCRRQSHFLDESNENGSLTGSPRRYGRPQSKAPGIKGPRFGDLFFNDGCRDPWSCLEAASSEAVLSNMAALFAMELIVLAVPSVRLEPRLRVVVLVKDGGLLLGRGAVCCGLEEALS